MPGMKQDMFDRVGKGKKAGPQVKGKAAPDCPKSDGMSPFTGIAFAMGDVFVRLNGTEGQCQRLVSVGGANFSELTNFSKTCGPAGEWKYRIAENLSSVFFQGGLDWVKSDNDTIEVITEEGTFEVVVSEAKYQTVLECWKMSCGCEQANNPVARGIFVAMLCVAIAGVGWDSVKLAIDKIRGKKPPKKVMCKKGHNMEEVKFTGKNYCDMCSTSGTTYQCSASCNYDLCKNCYKATKKKVKAELAAWLEKHPDDPDNKKKDKKKKDDDAESEKEGESESQADKGSESESQVADNAKADQEPEERQKKEPEKDSEGAEKETESEG